MNASNATTNAGPLPPEGRLARRKARTHSAIVDAATHLFTTQGYGATSIQQVAQDAGIGVGTLYGYFASKEDLFRAVLTRRWSTVIDDYVAANDPQAPVLEQVVTSIRMLANYLRSDRRLLRTAFALQPMRAADGSRSKEEAVFAGQVLGSMARLIEKGTAEGSIGAVPARTAAGVLMSSTTLAMLHLGPWQDSRDHDDDELIEDLDRLTRQLLRP